MNIEKFDTCYKYESSDRRVKTLDLVVLHYTASPYSVAHGGSNRKRIRRWMEGKGRKSSTHFTVLRNGDILQCADLDERTWHSGGSELKSPSGEVLKGINFRSIGIDFDNVGRLYKVDGGFVDSYAYAAMKASPGKKPTYYQGPAPYKAQDGSYWEPYSEASLDAMKELLSYIADEFPVLREEPWRLTGHENIRRTKSDPGPACPVEELRSSMVEGVVYS